MPRERSKVVRLNKTILAILLITSMIFVLYPAIDSLIKAQNAINELNRGYLQFDLYNDSLDYARNNAVMQITGLVILYVFLFLFLKSGLQYFGKQQTQITSEEFQQLKPAQAKTLTIQPMKPKTSKVLTGRTKAIIVLLSVIAFFPAFFAN